MEGIFIGILGWIMLIGWILTFIITYESIPFFRSIFDNDYYDEKEFVFGGLIYSFWKKFAIRNGLDPKKSYRRLGYLMAIVFYILPLIILILWLIIQHISSANDASIAFIRILSLCFFIPLIIFFAPKFLISFFTFFDNIMKNAEYEDVEVYPDIFGLNLIVKSNPNISLTDLEKIVKNIISSESYNALKVNFETLKKFFLESPKEERIKLQELQDLLVNSPEKNDFIIALMEYSITPNRPKKAIYWLSNAIDKNPGKNSIYYACRGFIFQESKEDDNAYSDLKEACISGNIAAINFLILEYEDRLVKDLEIYIDNGEDQNSKDGILFSNIQNRLLDLFEDGATMNIGTSEDGRFLIVYDDTSYLAYNIVNKYLE
tara:strand:- start:86 stop:1210 length:1125 start_codon:yes stop_codon:yes gene_type:complete